MKLHEIIQYSQMAHYFHEPYNFDLAVATARRVSADPRATDVHVAVAYLQDIGRTARITGADLVAAGVPAQVVRAVNRLEYNLDDTFIDYLQRISEHTDTALVAYHNFTVRLEHLDPVDDDDLTRRFRQAATVLNDAVDMGTPRSG